MVLLDEMTGTDGIFPRGCTSFISSSAAFSEYGFEANDTMIIPEGEDDKGVYHVNSVVDDNVLILNRTSVTSATSISWYISKTVNRIAQDASDDVDERLADISPVITVPFDRKMLESGFSSLADLDESIPLSLKGYTLNLQIQANTFPVTVSLTGHGEYLDWRNADVVSIFSTDTRERPTTDVKTITETVTFTEAGTLLSDNAYTDIAALSAANSTSTGTLTVKLKVPRTVRRLAALEAVIQLVQGNFIQGTNNRSEWIEQLKDERKEIYSEYKAGIRNLAELTESTLQRGSARSVKIARM